MGSLDQPHTCRSCPTSRYALIALGDHDDADGRAWILPAAPPTTGRRFIELASAAADEPPRPVAVSGGMMHLARDSSPP